MLLIQRVILKYSQELNRLLMKSEYRIFNWRTMWHYCIAVEPPETQMKEIEKKLQNFFG